MQDKYLQGTILLVNVTLVCYRKTRTCIKNSKVRIKKTT